MYCCSSLSPSQSQPAAARTVNPTRVSGGGVAATLDIQERTGPAAPDSSGEKSTNRKSERFLFEIKGERAYGEKEMAVTIAFVKARKIFDSCGNPTVEGPLNYAVKVDIALRDGSFTRGAVSSSASTGIYEALELRDGGPDYLGKGVLKAVDNVNRIIGPAIIGKDPTEQVDIDNFMVQQLDGTSNEWGWCKQKCHWLCAKLELW